MFISGVAIERPISHIRYRAKDIANRKLVKVSKHGDIRIDQRFSIKKEKVRKSIARHLLSSHFRLEYSKSRGSYRLHTGYGVYVLTDNAKVITVLKYENGITEEDYKTLTKRERYELLVRLGMKPPKQESQSESLFL